MKNPSKNADEINRYRINFDMMLHVFENGSRKSGRTYRTIHNLQPNDVLVVPTHSCARHYSYEISKLVKPIDHVHILVHDVNKDGRLIDYVHSEFRGKEKIGELVLSHDWIHTYYDFRLRNLAYELDDITSLYPEFTPKESCLFEQKVVYI